MSSTPNPPTFPKGADRPVENQTPKTVPDPPASEPILKPGKGGRFKGQHIGLDTDLLEAYIGSLKWKIRPDGHTKKIVDQVKLIQKTYEIAFQALEDDPKALTYQKEEVYEVATKAILNLALIGFNYEEAANHIDAGPGALGILSNEIRAFLVDLGGREGQKHLQMLSKLATQNISDGLKT